MVITYRTNGTTTTRELTEWYFGKLFVERLTAAAMLMHEQTGETEFKFWQNGTGYMTVEIH